MTLIPSIPYTLIRTRRKSFAIIVENDGGVTVRAPLRATHAQVQAVIATKARWIKERQEQVRQAAAAHPPRRFQPGELFPYLGIDYPLAIVERRTPALVLDKQFELSHTVLDGSQRGAAATRNVSAGSLKTGAQRGATTTRVEGGGMVRQVFEDWYKIQARKYFQQRVAHYAKLHGLTVRRLRLSSARTRWGSCSSLGDINLVWRLIMAPPEIIDYVIVHELAHRVERNHSARYWHQVEKMMPDYRPRRAWLKKNGVRLSWD